LLCDFNCIVVYAFNSSHLPSATWHHDFERYMNALRAISTQEAADPPNDFVPDVSKLLQLLSCEASRLV
jgi:hypothetical protein